MSRTPDMVLSVMDKTTGARSGKIGAAWHNEDGSISLVLNPGAASPTTPIWWSCCSQTRCRPPLSNHEVRQRPRANTRPGWTQECLKKV